MSSRRLAALAAACALAANGASYAASYGAAPAGGDAGSQSGAYPGITHLQAAYGGTAAANSGAAMLRAYTGSTGGTATGGSTTGTTAGGATTGAANGAANGAATTSNDSLLMHGTGVSQQALLAGGNEVGSDGKADAGDPDGNGAASISIDPEAGKLCFAIVVNNLDAPVAAHLHQGTAGRNGPVVVTLKAPDSGDPGTASGCVDNVDRMLLQTIHAHPWAYYINVHSGAYPDGAVRGQLY